MYDITIWEEIRDRVEVRTRALIDTINREISTDRSLRELYEVYPAPWQLGEVLYQRAATWLNRLYGCCCEARKAHGKEIDYSFNWAVWAYCIEPFTSRETQNAYGYRASPLMEVLLCAVGSAPEKRRSLTVSHRQCCDRVRERLLKEWYEKLHGLDANAKEAARALSLHRQMEIRAAQIVRGATAQPAAAASAALSNVQTEILSESPKEPSIVSQGQEVSPQSSTPSNLTSPSNIVQSAVSQAPAAQTAKASFDPVEPLPKSSAFSLEDESARREVVIGMIRNPQKHMFLTRNQASLFFGVTGHTIHRWIREGKLKRGARRSLVTIESVLQWHKKQSK